MDQNHPDPGRKASFLLRAVLIYGSTAALTIVGFLALYLVVQAKRRINVDALPRDDQGIFCILNSRTLGEFTDFPLRGRQGRTHLPLNVAKAVALAPASISIGLRRFNDLKDESKRSFGQTLCAGGDSEQIDEFCRRIKAGEIDSTSAVAFVQWMRYLVVRRIPLRHEWIDALVSREWTQDQSDELRWALRELVLYPGWSAPWHDFGEWWKSNRGSLKADIGGPFRLPS